MKQIKNMTLKEKLGQLIFFGFFGEKLPQDAIELIHEYKVGNVILFTRNINDTKQLYNLSKDIHKEIIKATQIMPFIAIDQEGGMVTRILDGGIFPPGNMSLAATDANKTYEMAKIVGSELRALGINVNFAPVLDINNNPENPVIGVRSYSDNPETVSKHGLNYIKGLRETGIIATAKHFPGHGDTEFDSHHFLPIINHDKQRLESIELYPFKKAIKENVPAIMSAHVIFPAYEKSKVPATLSSAVLTDLLRKELGYRGLVVSDCMEMKAIDTHFTTPVGVLKGILAGLDMAVVSHTAEKVRTALRLLEEAYYSGELSEACLNEKVKRILEHKESICPVIKKYFYDTSYSDAVLVLDAQEGKQLASLITDTSLTMVKGKEFYPGKKTLLLAPDPFATTIAEDAVSTRSIIDAAKKAGLPFGFLKYELDLTDEAIESIINEARFYETVVICTYNAVKISAQARLVRKLYRTCADVFVLSTRNPFDILAFPEIENYICLYEYTPNSVATIIKFLKRELLPSGQLPISLYGGFKRGASLYVGLADYTIKDNKAYLSLLKKHNIERVFISAHMPEMNKGFQDELYEIVSITDKLGMKVILDVSGSVFRNMNVPNIYALRIDFGFSREEILQLLKEAPYKIELNASTVSENDLKYFITNNVDIRKIRISHNFYPKPATGLSWNTVQKKNEMFRRYGLKVMGFIPSAHGKRPPLYEGLPTVEAHRYLPLPLILAEMSFLGFDEVFFGDAFVGEDELINLKNFDRKCILIPIVLEPGLSEVERDILFKRHCNRIDGAPDIIRSSLWRTSDEIVPRNTVSRKAYSVTIDNKTFKRYEGEISIVINDLPADNRVNVIGKAIITEFLIEKLKEGNPFRFYEMTGVIHEKSNHCR